MPEFIEQLESRSISSSGGRGTGKRTFFASGYSDISLVLKAFGIATTSDGSGGTLLTPVKGSSFPSFSGLIAKDFSITPVSGHTDLWKIDWSYEMVTTDYFTFPPEPIAELPNEVGYVELSSEIRAEFVLVFRENPNLPDRGIPEQPAEGEQQDPEIDIEGEHIDVGGNPVSTVRKIQELVLTETVEGEPPFGTYGRFRFNRNSVPFLGARPGRVLYRGCSVRRTGVEVYQVSHSFIDDDAFHLKQQPLVDQNGKPLLDGNRTAKEVYFIQPFPDMDDLNGISDNF